MGPRECYRKTEYTFPIRTDTNAGSECQTVRSDARVPAPDRPNQRTRSLTSPHRSFHRPLSPRRARARAQPERRAGETEPGAVTVVLSGRIDKAMTGLRAKLETAYKTSGGKKVNLISHSMGGLLVRCFMSMNHDVSFHVY